MGVTENLVDLVWGSKRPPRPREPVKVLDVRYAGKTFEDKLVDLRKELEKKKSAGFIACGYTLFGVDVFPARIMSLIHEQVCWMRWPGSTTSVAMSESWSMISKASHR